MSIDPHRPLPDGVYSPAGGRLLASGLFLTALAAGLAAALVLSFSSGQPGTTAWVGRVILALFAIGVGALGLTALGALVRRRLVLDPLGIKSGAGRAVVAYWDQPLTAYLLPAVTAQRRRNVPVVVAMREVSFPGVIVTDAEDRVVLRLIGNVWPPELVLALGLRLRAQHGVRCESLNGKVPLWFLLRSTTLTPRELAERAHG